MDNNREPIRINPDHHPLQDAEIICEHINSLPLTDAGHGECHSAFPIHIFPKPVQNFINATKECLNFPEDYTAASILYATSVAIGNTHTVEIKKGWQEKAVLYLAIVGNAGTNKSHPVSFALKPIEAADSKAFSNYQKEQAEYEYLDKLTKKEREDQGHTDLIKPTWKQHLVSDFTPEALAQVHTHNSRGIGVNVDELASWFKNFNRYNKGSEEQFWLSVWSGKPIRINRKTSEPIYIKSPFVSVAGTIQPGVLNELANNRTENGFMDRILFVAPENIKKEYWSNQDLDNDIESQWTSILNRLLSLEMEIDEGDNPQSYALRIDSEAHNCLLEWQKRITDETNNSDNKLLGGLYAKMEIYVFRLALCLEMLFYGCKQSEKTHISLDSVKGAIDLVDYFVKSAIKVHNILANTCPTEKLDAFKRSIYKELPENFKTEEGIKIAKEQGMPERTFKRFLQNNELFINKKRGEYEKCTT